MSTAAECTSGSSPADGSLLFFNILSLTTWLTSNKIVRLNCFYLLQLKLTYNISVSKIIKESTTERKDLP